MSLARLAAHGSFVIMEKKTDKNVQKKCKHARKMNMAVNGLMGEFIVIMEKKTDKNVQEMRKYARKEAAYAIPRPALSTLNVALSGAVENLSEKSVIRVVHVVCTYGGENR